MPACLNCNIEFPEAPRRGPRPKTFCSRPCQIKQANERRSIKRRGNLSTAGEPSGQPLSPEATNTPPSAKTPASDLPSRLEFLMDKAHSRVGVTAFEVAEIAKLKGRSPWAPLAKILAP